VQCARLFLHYRNTARKMFVSPKKMATRSDRRFLVTKFTSLLRCFPLQSAAYTSDYLYLSWLARCYIMNRKARQVCPSTHFSTPCSLSKVRASAPLPLTCVGVTGVGTLPEDGHVLREPQPSAADRQRLLQGTCCVSIFKFYSSHAQILFFSRRD
jgi:hypothetical protein